MVNFLDNGNKAYRLFRTERFLKKEKKLTDTIKRTKIPLWLPNKIKDNAEKKAVDNKTLIMNLGKGQKKMDIARDISLQEILKYDILPDCSLFDNIGIRPHKIYEMLKPLESVLKENDYKLNMNLDISTALIIDFMSMIRKVPFRLNNNIKEALESLWSTVMSIGTVKVIHIVYDSYLEFSIKESERVHRSENVIPVDIVRLGLDSVILVDLSSFWSSSRNKEQLQVASSSRFFRGKATVLDLDLTLSGCVADAIGRHPAEHIVHVVVKEVPELLSGIEEADLRIIPHTANAIQAGIKRAVVVSTDTDVVMYTLAHYQNFNELGVKEVWVRFGSKDNRQNIPISKLAHHYGATKSKALAKAYFGTGCNPLIKVGSKASAYKSEPENYLQNFGTESKNDADFEAAERFLVRVVDPRSNCDTFDELRYQMYKNKEKSINELPPTSAAIHAHLLRRHYVTHLNLNVLENPSIELDPVDYGWTFENGLLEPVKNLVQIPPEFVIRCKCKAGCKRSCGCKRAQEKCTLYYGCKDCVNM